jgi:hypothetical protein
MNCHNQTMAATDFFWSLNDHAFLPASPSLLLKNQAFQNLEDLMGFLGRLTGHTIVESANPYLAPLLFLGFKGRLSQFVTDRPSLSQHRVVLPTPKRTVYE